MRRWTRRAYVAWRAISAAQGRASRRPAAQALAHQLMRVLSPDGALFALFGATVPSASPRYTKFVIVDESNLLYQPYEAVRAPKSSLPNRDILRLFGGLQVADSFLLQNNVREILFRKSQ